MTERWRYEAEHWAVTVERNGEQVVTIASNSLSGRDLSAEDEACIRQCAEHLLAFIGDLRLIERVERESEPDIALRAHYLHEWARQIRQAEDQDTLLAIADDMDVNARAMAGARAASPSGERQPDEQGA